MSQTFEHRCAALVANLGLAKASDILSIRPLTGGVASDIGVVTLPDREICVKFALAKLKVAEDWRAPVHRNKAEYAWLLAAGACVPDNVPRLFGWSAADNGFAMEYLTGADVYLWKDALLRGAPDRKEAIAVAAVLGNIHAASSAVEFDRSAFDNRDDFRALRLEPYLSFTADRHPEIAPRLNALVERLYRAETVLVHGDVSPKNILFRNGKPIILDAECATMGDPGFDVSFCLNHLIIKSVHIPASRRVLLSSAGDFWATYARAIDWEDAGATEARVAELVPALMLARIDGKSPVEYLSDAERARIRAMALSLIVHPVPTIADLIGAISEKCDS